MDLLLLALVFLALLGAYLWWNRSALHVAQAHAAYRKGDEPAVLAAFAKAEAAGRLDADSTVSYAYLLLKTGSPDAAGELLDRAVVSGCRGRPLKESQRRLTQTYRSLVLWKQGRLAEAVQVLEDLLALGYRTLTLYSNLGFLLIEQQNWDRAEVVCLEAADWDTEGKVILDNLGYLYLSQGKWEQAAEVYGRLLTLDPRFPEAWWNAGQVALHGGDQAEARRHWKKALTLEFTALSTVGRLEIEKALGQL